RIASAASLLSIDRRRAARSASEAGTTSPTPAMPDNPITVADLEHDLENAFDHVRELEQRGQLPHELRPLLLLAPVEGTSVHGSPRHRDMGRQIRRTYGAQAFDQRDGAAWIVFEVPRPDRDQGRGRFDENEREGSGRRHEAGDPFDEFV